MKRRDFLKWTGYTSVTGIAAAVGFGGCSSPAEDPWGSAKSPRVLATFAPLQCFALNVVGDLGSVRGLLTTDGPHHADPAASQSRLVAKADLLIANGLGVDDRIVKRMSSSVEKMPLISKVGANIPKELLIEGKCSCCHDEDEKDHDHEDHKQIDGHVWLGIETAKRIVSEIAGAYQHFENKSKPSKDPSIWPSHQNAKSYIAKLDKLHAEGKALLKDKQDRTILPFHGSLAYFAKSFDLKLIDPIQDVPGQEPTAKQLDAIVAKCLKYKCRVIAVEPQFGAGNSAKAVLEALKAKGVPDPVAVTIDPLETCPEDALNAGWYEAKMRENLNNLAQVLA